MISLENSEVFSFLEQASKKIMQKWFYISKSLEK